MKRPWDSVCHAIWEANVETKSSETADSKEERTMLKKTYTDLLPSKKPGEGIVETRWLRKNSLLISSRDISEEPEEKRPWTRKTYTELLPKIESDRGIMEVSGGKRSWTRWLRKSSLLISSRDISEELEENRTWTR